MTVGSPMTDEESGPAEKDENKFKEKTEPKRGFSKKTREGTRKSERLRKDEILVIKVKWRWRKRENGKLCEEIFVF